MMPVSGFGEDSSCSADRLEPFPVSRSDRGSLGVVRKSPLRKSPLPISNRQGTFATFHWTGIPEDALKKRKYTSAECTGMETAWRV